jgi:hypothetical protein
VCVNERVRGNAKVWGYLGPCSGTSPSSPCDLTLLDISTNFPTISRAANHSYPHSHFIPSSSGDDDGKHVWKHVCLHCSIFPSRVSLSLISVSISISISISISTATGPDLRAHVRQRRAPETEEFLPPRPMPPPANPVLVIRPRLATQLATRQPAERHASAVALIAC